MRSFFRRPVKRDLKGQRSVFKESESGAVRTKVSVDPKAGRVWVQLCLLQRLTVWSITKH